MKLNKNIFKIYVLIVFLLTSVLGFSQFQPIQLDPLSNENTCNLNGHEVKISVPSEVLTGDNINLNITLPGDYDETCIKSVSINSSSNLLFQGSSTVQNGTPFIINLGGGLSENNPSNLLAGNDGQDFNVYFKFPNYVTCDGDVGTFDVTVELDCNDQVYTCTTSVNVTARADNYWSVGKEYVKGNLTCGISRWLIRVYHNNPNGSGLGTYSLSGAITENPNVPIITGGVFNFNNSTMSINNSYPKTVTLQNCSSEGSVITNSAEYNFTLGDGCETMTGTVTAVSDTLVSPNADISFTKSVFDNNGHLESKPYFNLPPECDGYYRIRIQNNGNVPFTNLVITDDLNIPGINITDINTNGWTINPTPPPSQPLNGNYTFSSPSSFTLDPGYSHYIRIYFEVDSGTSAGTTISNTASINYQAVGTGSSTGVGGTTTDSCPGINCPEIDTSIQNTTASVDFEVSNPEPIASIKKCIINPPNSVVPPIYQIGDIIKFSVMIGNSGAAVLNTTLTDALGLPNQNLQIDFSSLSYEYYPDEGKYLNDDCSPNFEGAPITSLPFSVTSNLSAISTPVELQNPIWNIVDMPGICDYNRSNFLVITFEAEILPQIYGNKTNTASIPSTTWGNTHSSSVNYTIDEVGILEVYKEADAEFVENGQSFNYEITVSNNGSVPLDNLVITDMLPSCVSVDGQINIEDEYGTSINYTTSSNLTVTIDPSAQIVPGNDFTITIPVTASGNETCCNESVSVTADMTTSGTELTANYGNAQAPAACVSVTGSTSQGDCIDFEHSPNVNNWEQINVNNISVITSAGSNSTNHLYFEDASGGSLVVNDVDFSGNWNSIAQDPCLCFDYRVNYNVNVGTTRRGPLLQIYKFNNGNTINNFADWSNFATNGNIEGYRASFVANPSNPFIQSNIWNHYCLPLDTSSGNLPSNPNGEWVIKYSDGAGNVTTLSGAAAIAAWNNLIIDVGGLILPADYNAQPSEEISFDNFCWNCTDDDTNPEPEECCDIEGFDASIQENNGSFSVTVNGGSVPLQEVEISMVDYHIEYTNEECKPDNLGIFGTLNTSTTNLGNLILNSGDNGTSSLSWLLGNPSVINNSTIDLDVLYPEVLDLECCEVDFSFCIKVKVVDADCNVCEEIICYSPNGEPEPCEIEIDRLDASYCVGDTVNLNWTSSNVTPGDLNIYFMQSNGSLEGIVATSVQNSGSYQFTIPEEMECDTDKQWYFYIGDKDRECFELSNLFTIKCCDDDPKCNCGKWKDKEVIINGYKERIPRDPRKNINVNSNFVSKVGCGEKIKLDTRLNYTFTSPTYICNPEDCETEYKWQIEDANSIVQSGTGQTFNYSFNNYGNYTIVFTPICGGKKCKPCEIDILVPRPGIDVIDSIDVDIDRKN